VFYYGQRCTACYPPPCQRRFILFAFLVFWPISHVLPRTSASPFHSFPPPHRCKFPALVDPIVFASLDLSGVFLFFRSICIWLFGCPTKPPPLRTFFPQLRPSCPSSSFLDLVCSFFFSTLFFTPVLHLADPPFVIRLFWPFFGSFFFFLPWSEWRSFFPFCP